MGHVMGDASIWDVHASQEIAIEISKHTAP